MTEKEVSNYLEEVESSELDCPRLPLLDAEALLFYVLLTEDFSDVDALGGAKCLRAILQLIVDEKSRTIPVDYIVITIGTILLSYTSDSNLIQKIKVGFMKAYTELDSEKAIYGYITRQLLIKKKEKMKSEN